MKKSSLLLISVYLFTSMASAAERPVVVNADGHVISEPRSLELTTDHRYPIKTPAKQTKNSVDRDASAPTLRQSADQERGTVIDFQGLITAADSGIVDQTRKPASQRSQATIDLMTIDPYSGNYQPYLPFFVVRYPDQYTLSDGSSWNSGAGGFGSGRVLPDSVSDDGTTLRFEFTTFDGGMIFDFTDYDSGDHSAVGRLDLVGPLIIEAPVGSTTGLVSADLVIVSNEPANYQDERFNYFSALTGSVVRLQANIENLTGEWKGDSFDSNLSYRTSDGTVDFANPISEPQLSSLSVNGSQQLPPDSTIAFTASAGYENGISRDVTSDAIWTIDPADAASISAEGVVTTGAAPADDTVMTVNASYDGLDALTSVTVIGQATLLQAEADWDTFQGDIGHTGYVGGTTDPEDFSLRWQKSVSTRALSQPAAGGGRVYVSADGYFDSGEQLFALDAVDGEIIWTRQFGAVFSVNPPALAYGNVYIQTGKPTSGTPYLRGINGETGHDIFVAPFGAQWERYLAPTVSDGGVYINGGHYGGMYRFDAFSGQQMWFSNSLPQYDGWTPALVNDTAYAYVGGTFYAIDRDTSATRYAIQDPNFDWNGYDMRGAVALAGESKAVAMHNGRLVVFNIDSPGLAWDIAGGFTGQPIIVEDEIIIANGDGLQGFALVDGALRWSWQAPAGADVSGPIVASDTHVFASTSGSTYAIERLSHTDVWSFAASGNLAIADDHLYIAGADGVLTAIAMPVILDSPVVALTISGPDVVMENSVAEFRATVTYEDGRERDRTVQSTWLMKPSEVASLDDSGRLSVVELLAPRESLIVEVEYTESDVTLEAAKKVNLYTPLSDQEFAVRNITAADLIKSSVLEQLLDARRHELSAQGALEGILNEDEMQALQDVIDALASGDAAYADIEDSLEALQRALQQLQGPTRPQR